MQIPGKLTISRPGSSLDSEFLAIEISDTNSMQKIRLEVSLHDFTLATTGVARVNCSLDMPSDPTRIGKSREQKVIEAKGDPLDREGSLDALKAACPDGWEVSEYLGNQNSFFKKDGEDWCRTTAYRWVEKERSSTHD